MKLKKIASLALAGIMAVSMLTACGEGGNGNNGGENPPADQGTSAGLSAEILNMSAYRTVKNVNGVDSVSLNNAVKAAAAIMGKGNDASDFTDLAQLQDSFGDYGKTMLNAAKSKMGTAEYLGDIINEKWAYVKNEADNDDHTVYNVYVVAQNLGDEAIKNLIAKKLEAIYPEIGVDTDVKLADSYSYDVSVAMADWQVGKDANVEKDGVIVGIAVTLHYDAAAFN